MGITMKILKQKKHKTIYFGWRIVFTCSLLMALIYSPLLALAGIFTIPITDELNLTRASFNMHITICTLTTMLASLIAARMFYRYRIKPVMALAAITIAACFIGFTVSNRLWQFYSISAISGICVAFVGVVPISTLINNWFGEKLRGKATGIAFVGSGIGSMILNPLLSKINTAYGWRYSYYLLAALIVVIVVPMIVLTIVKTPDEKGLAKLGNDDENKNLRPVSDSPQSQAYRSKLLILVFIIFLFFGIVGTIFNGNIISYLISIGFSSVKAGTLMSVTAVGIIIGKLMLGSAGDKWGAKRASIGITIFFIIGTALLMFTPMLNDISALALFFCGVGNSSATVAIPLIAAEFFGNSDFNSALGVSNLSISLGASVGPLLGALIYDETGTYFYAWALCVVLLIATLATLYISYKIKISSISSETGREQDSSAN